MRLTWLQACRARNKVMYDMLRNRTLLTVSITVCAASTGIGMVVPVRVLYAESQGASLAIIGAMASAYLISNYGFSNWFFLVLALFPLQGILYAFIQPAVDLNVAIAAARQARARIMGLYSAFGLAGGFAGANGFSLLYAWNFRYPLFALGIGYGLCVLIGGLLIRHAEKKCPWLYTPKDG